MTRLRALVPLAALLMLTALAHQAAAGARRSRPLRTGQTTCADSNGTAINCEATGQDGDYQAGESRAYVDNGNGTIKDNRTALTWEKLSDDHYSIHDKDNRYTWAEAFGKIDDLNATAFAGFADWRLPNLFELQTLLNLGVVNPAVSAIFNTNCGTNSSGNPGCTSTTCSCTANSYRYWSSSSVAVPAYYAWGVNFDVGNSTAESKTFPGYVRAVRGGSGLPRPTPTPQPSEMCFDGAPALTSPGHYTIASVSIPEGDVRSWCVDVPESVYSITVQTLNHASVGCGVRTLTLRHTDLVTFPSVALTVSGSEPYVGLSQLGGACGYVKPGCPERVPGGQYEVRITGGLSTPECQTLTVGIQLQS